MIMILQASLFLKRFYNIFLVAFTMFKPVKGERHMDYMRQKFSKSTLIVKLHPGMKCLHISFPFFIPGQNLISVLLTDISSFRDEISSLRNRVNIKRDFTILRDDFILG